MILSQQWKAKKNLALLVIMFSAKFKGTSAELKNWELAPKLNFRYNHALQPQNKNKLLGNDALNFFYTRIFF